MKHFVILLSLFTLALSLTVRNGIAKEIPQSFLDFKLGMTLSDFQKNNPDAKKINAYDFNDIKVILKGMEVYFIKKRATDDGKKVNIKCGFYKGACAVIEVGYRDTVYYQDILDSLEKKYGRATSNKSEEIYEEDNKLIKSEILELTPAIDVKKIDFWDFPSCLFYLAYLKGSQDAVLTFADKKVQNILKK